MASQNAVMGDENFGTNLPQAKVDEKALDEIKKAAKYSKSAEFQKLKERMQTRIEYYQKYIPQGNVGVSPSSDQWAIANTVIAELRYIIDDYEKAEELAADGIAE